MANRGLTALPNDQLIAFLNSAMRDRFHHVALIGADAVNNTTLKRLLQSTANLTYDDVSRYVFAEFDAEVTYFDDSGIFTAVVDMTNEEGYNKHLYGVILMSDSHEVATIAKTPIIYLNEQIGGQFPIKIPIKGEAGEVVFRSSKYLTQYEAEQLFLAPNWLQVSTLRLALLKAELSALAKGKETENTINLLSKKVEEDRKAVLKQVEDLGSRLFELTTTNQKAILGLEIKGVNQ